MTLTPSITSLTRALEHHSFLIETWARTREQKILSNLAAHSREPDYVPIVPEPDWLDLSSRVLWRLTAVAKTLDAFMKSADNKSTDSPIPVAAQSLRPSTPLNPLSPSTPDAPVDPILPQAPTTPSNPIHRPSILDNLPDIVEGFDLSRLTTDLTPETMTATQLRTYHWALEHPEDDAAREFFLYNLQLAPPDFRLPVFMTDPRFSDDDWFNAECRRMAAEAEAGLEPQRPAPYVPPSKTAPADSTQSSIPNPQHPSGSPSTSSTQSTSSITPSVGAIHAAPCVPSVPCIPGIAPIAAPSLAAIATSTDALFAETESFAAAHNLPFPPADADVLVPDEPDSPHNPIDPADCASLPQIAESVQQFYSSLKSPPHSPT